MFAMDIILFLRLKMLLKNWLLKGNLRQRLR
mgnify:CR=1 FL=1